MKITSCHSQIFWSRKLSLCKLFLPTKTSVAVEKYFTLLQKFDWRNISLHRISGDENFLPANFLTCQKCSLNKFLPTTNFFRRQLIILLPTKTLSDKPIFQFTKLSNSINFYSRNISRLRSFKSYKTFAIHKLPARQTSFDNKFIRTKYFCRRNQFCRQTTSCRTQTTSCRSS